MICPKCKFEQDDKNIECLKCGIIFHKYMQHHNLNFQNKKKIETDVQSFYKITLIKDLLFFVKPQIHPFFLGGRVIIFLVLLIWTWKFIFIPFENNYLGTHFLHLVNLPFHEAGHIIFRPFGKIITSLGGTLSQLLIPLICCIVFLIKYKDSFGACVTFWWFGENFIDIAPYINDARSLSLPLLGGNTGFTSPYGFHDWEFILTELRLLRYDYIIASISHKIGSILMLLSLVWAGYLLFKQYKNLN